MFSDREKIRAKHERDRKAALYVQLAHASHEQAIIDNRKVDDALLEKKRAKELAALKKYYDALEADK